MFKKLSKLSILTLLISSFIFIDAFAGNILQNKAKLAAIQSKAPEFNRTLSAQAVAKMANFNKNISNTIKDRSRIVSTITTKPVVVTAPYASRGKNLDITFGRSKKRFDRASKDVMSKARIKELKSGKSNIHTIAVGGSAADTIARLTDQGLLG